MTNSTAFPKELATQVELSISAENLPSKDLTSKSDPVCILYAKNDTSNSYQEIARSESLRNTNNPRWVTKFEIAYHFEERQILRFHVFDWDTNSTNHQEQDSLGYIDCSLAEIMSYQGSQVKKDLVKGGILYIIGEEMNSSKETAVFQCSANDLDKKDLFGKSDPFIVISRISETNVTIPVHSTEVIKKCLNPSWKQFELKVSSLVGSANNGRIKIECFDWDSDGSHDLIGECFTNFNELREQNYRNSLVNPKKSAKGKGYKDSGKLTVNLISIYIQPTFLDYIKGGLQLHFTLAIDFTASNGDQSHPNSLHYYQPGSDNQYSLAIKSIGEVVQDYDSDKQFPGLGFGAKVPPDFQVRFDFYLNGRQDSPYCQGVSGLLQAYENSLRTVQLYGPTNFAPVINHATKFASSYQDGSNYFVLLLITDGIITDLQNTRKSLVEASKFPLSVIIIGVGNEDFSAMELLDGDDNRLSYDGQFAERDIVQFVEMRKYINESDGHDVIKSQLAKEVLAEIPNQVMTWMKSRRITPGKS